MTDPSGTVIDTWTTTTHAEYDADGQKTGRRLPDRHSLQLPFPIQEGQYVLREESVPEGFEKAEDVIFTIGWKDHRILIDGESSDTKTVVMTDKKNVERGSLLIRKQVQGSMASRAAYFAFDVKISELQKNRTYPVDLEHADLNIPGDGADSERLSNPTELTTDSDGCIRTVFYLQADQSVTLRELPLGAGIEIRERANDYRTSAEVSKDAAIAFDGACASGTLVKDTEVTFINSREEIVPTGIEELMKESASILGTAMMLMALVWIRRKVW